MDPQEGRSLQHLFGDMAAAGLDSIDAEVAFLDQQGRILAANRAWRVFAQENDADDPEAYIGTPYLEAIDTAKGSEAARAAQAILEVLSRKVDRRSIEYPCHHPDGTPRWFILRVSRFRGEGPVEAVVVHDDITMRKMAEMAQQRLQDEKLRTARAEQSERSWTAVLNPLAHQINTPLTPILLDVSRLENAATGDLSHDLEKLRKNLQRLEEVTETALKILDMHHIPDADTQEEAWASLITDSVGALVAARGWKQIACDASGDGRARVHRPHIRTLLDELLHNADHYRPKGSAIQVRAGTEDGSVFVEVEDEGPGVSQEEADRIQDLFDNGMASLRGQETAGLGLLLCALIVQGHGGGLQLASRQGGLRVRATLPAS